MDDSRPRYPHFEVPLVLDGFAKSVPPGQVNALAFSSQNANEWFTRFVERLVAAVGQHHLPVYRMADGEFMFSVGPKAPLPKRGVHPVGYFAYLARRAIGFARSHDRCQTVWGECYGQKELGILRKSHAEQVRRIASEGILAVHFTRTDGRFAEQYIEPMCKWFSANGITLAEKNYVPFYFVYAALRGPSRSQLFGGRRVLVVTGADGAKRRAILAGLDREGVAHGEVYAISRDQAMRDVLDLGRISERPDVVLVAAGIGSSNILAQLAPLKTLCIDSGVCVECLADPTRADRVFLRPDE